MFTRRDFIKTMSLLSGTVLAPVRWLGKWAGVQPAQMEEPVEGELYAGFVLLPEGAPVPDFVTPPKQNAPILCNVGGNVEITGVIETFNDILESLSKLNFPIYSLSGPVSPAGGYVLSHKSGEIYGVEQTFTDSKSRGSEKDPRISLWAKPDFPRPKPIWSIESVEFEDPTVILHKVDFLPVPGIMAISPLERQFHWIENDVYFKLIVRETPTLNEAREYIDLLVAAQ